MREFTREQLLDGDPTAGLDVRLSALAACCAQVAREIVEAVEDGADYFDAGLRFAIITDPADLEPGGAVSAFLGVPGDPLPEALCRMEGCHYYADVRAHLLVLSVSDTSGDYLVVPDERLTPAWVRAMDDLLHASSGARTASTGGVEGDRA